MGNTALVEVFLTPLPLNILEGRLSKVFGHEGMAGDEYVLTATDITIYHAGRSASLEHGQPSFTVGLDDPHGIGLGFMVFCLTLATVAPVSIVSPTGRDEWGTAAMIVGEALNLAETDVNRLLTGLIEIGGTQ
jgi:hypothetical protein